MTTPWYRLSIESIKKRLHTDIYRGLDTNRVSLLQKQYGLNVFARGRRYTRMHAILSQFKSPLVFILVIAGVITIFLGQFIDATVITAALTINVIVGVIQEGRASRAFEHLQVSQQKSAILLRDGARRVISAKELVPGDVIFLEAGMHVPADARIVSETELSLNESMLTGEWVGVQKNAEEIADDVPLNGQKNMVWMGTLVTNGFGKAIVVATGAHTEVGSIASELSKKDTVLTPLQKSIKRLAAYLSIAIVFALGIILFLGLAHGQSVEEMVLVAIAIAVAAIPEGLPAAVTVVLALGMEAILAKKGLVRSLLAAETLGSTTVILTDKTGTLTEAKMRIARIVSAAGLFLSKEQIMEKQVRDNAEILAMGILTADAFVERYDDANSRWIVRGRPIEQALLIAGLGSGLRQEMLLKHSPKRDSIPFESERRFAATLHDRPGHAKKRVYITGAPETLMHAEFAYQGGKKVKMSERMREKFMRVQQEESDQGMRVIAVAYRDVEWELFPADVKKEGNENMLLSGIVFGGLFLIHDPIRPDVGKSINQARKAGARVIMVTGDNEHTARRVAVEVGIARLGGRALQGRDIEQMSDTELAAALKNTKIFARILPRQKTRLVQVLKNTGEVVAMTGDGINDAPALRRADIGIALGSGTEVAKEASDMILLNNSFTIIVRAIEEGRRILDNLKKIVAYLLSTSFSEIFLVGGALAVGSPLPLLPAQILWTNIIGEGFMNFSFAFEPIEDGAMKRDPHNPGMRRVVSEQLRSLIVIISLVTGIFLVALYFFLLRMDMPIEEVRTIMFAVLSVDSIFFSFSLKDLRKPLWRIDLFSNRYLILALAGSLGALLLALFVPALHTLLSLSPISGAVLGGIVAVGVFNLFIIELVKYIYFEKKRV